MNDSLLLVCPHCFTQNKVPQQRLSETPNCGKCKQALFTGQALELNNANFDRHFLKSDLPLLVDFWAPWCRPCKMMAPMFEQAAQQLEPLVRLAKINTEAEQALGARFGIRSIPTLKLFKNGNEIATQAGAMQTNDIVRWARQWI